MAKTDKHDVTEEAANDAGLTGGKPYAGDAGDSNTDEDIDATPGEHDGVECESEGDEMDPAAAAVEEIAAERDRYLRLAAEYDNFRKRSAKEREMIYSDARADTITRLLPVYDNLERALKVECADEAFYKGVEMTMTQLTDIFESLDVVPIPAVGEPFDPNRHNAVMAVEKPEIDEQTIVEEYQKGFMLGQRIIRFSTVVVAK